MKLKTIATYLIVVSFLPQVVIDASAQPVITKQPADQSVSLGATVKFQVSASSSHPPIGYQWRFASANLDGKTISSLNLTNIQSTNAGDYDAVFTDSSGSVTSRVAHLDVDPTFIKITAGPVVSSGGYGFGCAWGDYDDDGLIDLFVCNWSDGSFTQRDFLYHNRGEGAFDSITTAPMVTANAWATGASWGDYDNDGKLDLFVTRPGNTGQGRNTLYHNDGGGKFTKITTGLLVTQIMKSHAGIWADFDHDGWLDLFVANFGSSSSTPAADNYLFYNGGDGTFQQVSFGAKSLSNGDSFDAAAADFNNDGWIDLLVAQGAINNKQNSLPYANNGDSTFTLLTNSVIFTKAANSGAVAWGDYDNDGFPDFFLSNNAMGGGQTNLLYHNNRDGTFSLLTNSIAGLEAGNSTGCAWGDYDNDGWLDLFVARVGPYDSNFQVTAQENNCLYHNNGDGTFSKILTGSPVNEAGYSFGCAWGDYDNDGFLDLFVSNGFVQASANNFLYRNNGNSNNWINFKLVGTASNRSGIGAKVRVKATIAGKPVWQLREISGGSGHGCQNDLRANFGLGDATNADLVQIEWPSGIVQTLTNVTAKQFMKVVEHQPSASPTSIGSMAISFSTDGLAVLSAPGDSGLQFLFESSADLVTWTKLSTRTNVTSSTSFTDLKGTNYVKRFYRVSVP